MSDKNLHDICQVQEKVELVLRSLSEEWLEETEQSRLRCCMLSRSILKRFVATPV